MSLVLFGDISAPTTNTYANAVDNGTELDVITSDSTGVFRRFDLTTLGQLGTDVSLKSAVRAVGISMITSACAVIVYGNDTTVDLIQVSSGYRQNYSGGANTALGTSVFKGQQVAGDPSTSIAFASSSTNGEIVKINGSTFAVSKPTPAALSGAKALTVIVKEGGNAWLLGTNNGKVIEINSSGTSISTITLPTTPNTGSSPTLLVTGLSMYNDTLIVTTGNGGMYIYTYSTATLVNQTVVSPTKTAGNAGTVLCASPSGFTAYAPSNGTTNFTQAANTTTVLNFNHLPPTIEDSYTSQTVSAAISIGFAPQANKLWMITTSFAPIIRIWHFNPHPTTVNSAIYSSNSYQAGRIIRIKDPHLGGAFVESDQTISAAAIDIAAVQDAEYIEVAIVSGSPDKFSIRRFNT